MLMPSYRKPFGLIAGASKRAVDIFEQWVEISQKKAESEIRLSFTDAFRNSLYCILAL
jgi:hypothetical protein